MAIHLLPRRTDKVAARDTLARVLPNSILPARGADDVGWRRRRWRRRWWWRGSKNDDRRRRRPPRRRWWWPRRRRRRRWWRWCGARRRRQAGAHITVELPGIVLAVEIVDAGSSFDLPKSKACPAPSPGARWFHGRAARRRSIVNACAEHAARSTQHEAPFATVLVFGSWLPSFVAGHAQAEL